MALLELHYTGHNGQEVSYTINKGKKVYTRKVKSDGTFTQDGMPYQFVKSEKKINLLEAAFKTQEAQPLKPLQSEFSINKRFGFLEKFTNMVLDGETASAIVTGEGGLGKSHTVMQELEKRGWEEGVDFIVVKGYATPKALYGTLWEHADKTVIFDDCDSVLKDPTAVNILKGALDSYDKRIISWLQKGFIDDGLPNSFEFRGNVIFISNMSSDKLDQAIKSRSMTIDLSMTIEDKIERMSHILPNILPAYDIEMKEEVLDFMADNAEEAVEFNVRTLQKLIKTCHAYDGAAEWREAGKYLLTNN
jgi:Cdc6-like AAA superfamily ATPase